MLVVGRTQDASCSGCSSRATVSSAIMLALFLCPAIRKSWARAATSLGVISPVLTRSDICVNRSSPGFASLVHQAADAVKHSRFRLQLLLVAGFRQPFCMGWPYRRKPNLRSSGRHPRVRAHLHAPCRRWIQAEPPPDRQHDACPTWMETSRGAGRVRGRAGEGRRSRVRPPRKGWPPAGAPHQRSAW